MEVILRETIDTLGRAGQVVKVANGYARNFLLPRKLAYVATLDKVSVTVRRKVGEQNTLYGSVTNADVAEELAKKGYEIEKRKIVMDDHIKELGDFQSPVRIFKDVTAKVTLKVEAETEA